MRVERPSECPPHEFDFLHQVAPRCCRSRDYVGVTVEVLRRAMEHNVGAQAQGLLIDRGGEGAVDKEERANAVREPGCLRYVDELEGRVRRALNVHYRGVLLQVSAHLYDVRRLDHRGLNSQPR